MHPANCLSLEKVWMQNTIGHRLCFCRSRFLCVTPGILGGLVACVGWMWGASSEPSICSCNRNLMCLGWIERQALCSSLGQVCMWEQSVWNLLTQLVLHAALKCWCCGAGFCSFLVPWQSKTLDWLNNSCQSAFFEIPCFRFRVDLGYLWSPGSLGFESIPESWPCCSEQLSHGWCWLTGAGCSCLGTGLTLPAGMKDITWQEVLKGVCGDLWPPQHP